MKRAIAVAVVLGIVILAWGEVFAGWLSKESTTQESTVAEAATKKNTVATVSATAALDQQIAQLESSQWNIQIKPMSGKGSAESDILSFSDDKVSSKNLSNLGYSATNFSVRSQEDGTLIWETMQISEKDGTAFWRGDLREGVMSGVLSKRDKKGNTVNFSFTSVE
jgi:cytoskeletal protein RodZ